ncbi:MAG TPA: DUF1761 domain-containing protein [Kiloniellales bacterium]|nr:DUF1761 domain-containing protein [Kiloniellales bacterium]
MDFAAVDYLACLVAAVAAYAFGMVWYMGLSKAWVAAVGKSADELRANANPITFAVTALACFVTAVVLAMIWGGGLAMVGLWPVLRTAIILWVGFILTTVAVHHAYQGQRRSLTLIDGGYGLGVVVIESIVLWLFA